MAKTIKKHELSQLVSQLIDNPEVLGQEMSLETYANFLNSIAQAVCDTCGGELHQGASVTEAKDDWTIVIEGNECLPEDGGVWKDFDCEGELFYYKYHELKKEKDNFVQVNYISKWEEGEIQTSARLNLSTGLVDHIQVDDNNGSEYEHLEGEFIELLDGSLQVEIELNPNDTYEVSRHGDLFLLRHYFQNEGLKDTSQFKETKKPIVSARNISPSL